MKELKESDLSSQQKELLDRALKATEKSYAPYSGFRVGCALKTDKGIIVGANFENSSFGVTNCAERVAIQSAWMKGARDYEYLVIIARFNNGETTKDVISPCGACRQVIAEVAELCGKDVPLLLSTTDKSKIIETSIMELLPLHFGPKKLNVGVSDWI